MGQLAIIQEQQRGWVKHNFGDRPAWMPLFGIIEELGELTEAMTSDDAPGVADALADVMIFAADYCTAMGWDLALDVYDARIVKQPTSLMVWAGKLAHSHLKLEQGIRGGGDRHRSDLRYALRVLVGRLTRIATQYGLDLQEVTFRVWLTVKLRDWVAYPETGLPPEGGA